MIATCLTCGVFDHVEAHHVAGRHNHAALVVPVCRPCHLILTNWQYASGIELHEDAERTSLDQQRALVVGLGHLVQLYAQRHADVSWLPVDLAILGGRAASWMLVNLDGSEHAGRWISDPTVVRREGRPVSWDGETEATRACEWALLLLAVSAELRGEEGAKESTLVSRLRAMAARPDAYVAAFAAIAHDRTATGSLGVLLANYVDQAGDVARRLLALPQHVAPDEELFRAGADCLAAGAELLDRAFALAEDRLARDRRDWEVGR